MLRKKLIKNIKEKKLQKNIKKKLKIFKNNKKREKFKKYLKKFKNMHKIKCGFGGYCKWFSLWENLKR